MAFLVTMCQLCSFGEEIQAENFNIYNIYTKNIIIFVPSLLIKMSSPTLQCSPLKLLEM